jgi:hypothetical protein
MKVKSKSKKQKQNWKKQNSETCSIVSIVFIRYSGWINVHIVFNQMLMKGIYINMHKKYIKRVPFSYISYGGPRGRRFLGLEIFSVRAYENQAVYIFQ